MAGDRRRDPLRPRRRRRGAAPARVSPPALLLSRLALAVAVSSAFGLVATTAAQQQQHAHPAPASAAQQQSAETNPTAGAKSYSVEVLNSYPHPTSTLPHPLSDVTATFSMAPNEDGDLVTGIYLVGGCGSDYKGKPTITESGGVSGVQYNCPRREVTDGAVFYDPAGDMFIERRKMNRPRYRHGAVSVEGRLWVVGGRDGNDDPVGEVEVYDPGCEHWVTLGTLPTDKPQMGLSDFAIFTYEENIYIAGGYNADYEAVSTLVIIDTAITLDVNGDSLCRLDGTGGGGKGVRWTRGPSMKEARAMVGALIYGRYGYVVGGFTHQDGHCDPLKSVEIYDTAKSNWIAGGDLTHGRAGAALMKYNGRFFALGGETRLYDGGSWWNGDDPTTCDDVETHKLLPRRKSYPVNSVEVYNPLDGLDGEWRPIKGGLPEGERYRFVLAPWPNEDAIYAFGGVTNYDPDTSTKCRDCLHVSDAMVVYADESELVKVHSWWSDLFVAITGIWFAGTVISAFVQHSGEWRYKVREKLGWGGRKGGMSKGVSHDGIALVDVGIVTEDDDIGRHVLL